VKNFQLGIPVCLLALFKESVNLPGMRRPVCTEGGTRKTLLVFNTGRPCIGPNADEPSAFPAFIGLAHPGSTSWQCVLRTSETIT
jgi:hypothetical protein